MQVRTLALAALLAFPALAHNIQTNAPVPEVAIQKDGAITLEGKKFGYQPFNTDSLTGKVRVIQHFAGRTSAKEINEPLIDAIKAAHLPADKYQTVTIINVDDAIWGTGGFVRSSAKDAKKDYPWSEIVLDENGLVKKAWDLQPKSSAIVVVDPSGKVRFAKDGKLSSDEVKQVMTLVKQLLASA
ncbi:YtfJ family protein [Gallaecimonas kandeliae]|uniref:YtfJ family protein n=1 Tax=Gallaecimonas kandeliae TaxID=3029055 RepID=UPI002648A453|nr:YtfJ family protein [Gallaecimonas kandeliae]WKE66282.1 YtfJ family protein [Gallaecimonas kandeliae]